MDEELAGRVGGGITEPEPIEDVPIGELPIEDPPVDELPEDEPPIVLVPIPEPDDPIEEEPLLELDGMVDGLPEGDVDRGDVLSSTFLLQAPSASTVPRATAASAAGLNFEAYISVSLKLIKMELAEPQPEINLSAHHVFPIRPSPRQL